MFVTAVVLNVVFVVKLLMVWVEADQLMELRINSVAKSREYAHL